MGQQVRAQKAANETNLQIAQETNQMNYDIAQEANKMNYQMFQEQNAWNREQWNLENEYNSPANQVKRMQEAGINPLWGLGSADSGNASHLESAQSSPANVAQMQAAHVNPEYGLEALSHVQAALNSVSNDVKDFYRLGLETEDMRTRQRTQASQAALNRAEAMYKSSQTAGQNIFNNLNSETYGVQVTTKQQELIRLQKEIDKFGVDSELGRATKLNLDETRNQIIAQTKFIQTQTDGYLETLKQGWKRLAIDQQNANTSQFQAQSHAYYEGVAAHQRQSELNFQKDKFLTEINQKTNDQILKYVENQRGAWEKLVGYTGAEGGQNLNVSILQQIKAAGDELYKRMESNPYSISNKDAYNEYQKMVNSLTPPSQMVFPQNPPDTFSIINPYD